MPTQSISVILAKSGDEYTEFDVTTCQSQSK